MNNQNEDTSGNRPTLTHDEAMRVVFVRDPDGSLWAQIGQHTSLMQKLGLAPKGAIVATPVAHVDAVAAEYLNLLSASALLYQMNQHATEMLCKLAEDFEEQDQDAGPFIEMAANLNMARRTALEGLDVIITK